MAGGLVGLLDDVAAIAKLAAASIDDVGVAATKASAKAAGVVIDDAAVTPAYVQGLAADRELPIIKKIAIGSIRNKLIFILPVILLLSAVLPTAIEIILMAGGGYLCYEGAHKIYHKLKKDDIDKASEVPATLKGPDAEEQTIAGAVRTDLILSGEIMVIALKDLIDQDPDASFISRFFIMVVVAILITVVVYGAVALIVKMDDIGLAMARREDETSQRTGRMLVSAMPAVLKWLTIIGTAAMLWVGGHILVAGTHGLGWDGIYDPVHDAADWVSGIGGIGGLLGWLTNTFLSAIVGIIVGTILVLIIGRFHGGEHGAEHEVAAAH